MLYESGVHEECASQETRVLDVGGGLFEQQQHVRLYAAAAVYTVDVYIRERTETSKRRMSESLQCFIHV
jgi:shikimate kinase